MNNLKLHKKLVRKNEIKNLSDMGCFVLPVELMHALHSGSIFAMYEDDKKKLNDFKLMLRVNCFDVVPYKTELATITPCNYMSDQQQLTCKIWFNYNLNGFIFDMVTSELLDTPKKYNKGLLTSTYDQLIIKQEYIKASRIDHLLNIM